MKKKQELINKNGSLIEILLRFNLTARVWVALAFKAEANAERFNISASPIRHSLL